jgi:hypothetical protein
MNKYLKKAPKNLGMVLLSIWLILTGLIWLIDLNFDGLRSVMGLLAMAAGALLLWRR